MPRLITCHACRIIQRAPDVPKGTPMVPARMIFKDGTDFTYKDDQGYPVMVAQYDPILEDFVERHEHGFEDGVHIREGIIEVMAVDQATWNNIDVVSKIKGELHKQMGQWYEDRDFYREGAVECYNAHGNPTLETGCPDFLDDSKLIGTGTYNDGDGHTITIPPKMRQHLCNMCPYMHSYIAVEMRRRAGADRSPKER